MDLVYAALFAAFFILTAGLVWLADSLVGGGR